MRLSEFSASRNNFDLLRLVFAMLVLVGHVYGIDPSPQHPDITTAIFMNPRLHTLGLNGFFVISGFLVTRSFLLHGPIRYSLNRVLRIFPALGVCLLINVVAMSAFSSLAAGDYFSRPATWHWLWGNFSMTSSPPFLPGLWTNEHGQFEGVKSVANGPIWSLVAETRLYLLIFGLGVLGLLKNKPLSTAVIGGLIVISFYDVGLIPFMWSRPDFANACVYFFIGAIFYINRNFIFLYWRVAAISALMFFGLQPFKFMTYVSPLLFSYFVFYVAASTRPVPVKEHFGDLSYGIYIYAWPIMQAVRFTLGESGSITVLALTMALSLVAAVFSWFVIERPCLRLKSAKWVRFDMARARL